MDGEALASFSTLCVFRRVVVQGAGHVWAWFPIVSGGIGDLQTHVLDL